VAWDGVRDACTYGPVPMQGGNPMTAQTGLALPEMSEDCLYLNVWTPALDDARRPVLVWLHGGAFVVGAGSRPRGGMKFFRAMDPAVDTLDDAGLLARCRDLRPGVGQAEHVIEAYRTARQARGEDTSPPELWFAIAGDHLYRAPLMRQAELHAAHTPETYAYLFTWRSPARDGRLGAAHTMEIPFVFGRLDDPGMGPLTGQGSAVRRLSGQMMDAWIAFARTGHPATAALPAWPAYTADRRATMVFDEAVQVVDAPLEAERAVWTSYVFTGGTAR
jgi:carboxylesterase type B